MKLNSPLFDKIRVSSNKVEADKPQEKLCDHPGCQKPGEFRAPMGRDREGSYFTFCKDHIRDYNASYNYFDGMSDEDVAKYQKDASTGHRPTWTMGTHRKGDAPPATEATSEAMNLFRLRMNRRSSSASAAPRPRATQHGVAALHAMATLGLDDTADPNDVKLRYKSLVKKLHPDANGGDRSYEDKLREIIKAYNYLKSINMA